MTEEQITRAEELINKHLDKLNANNIIGKDGNIYKGFLNAINEALTITDVGCSDCDLEKLVNENREYILGFYTGDELKKYLSNNYE